MIEIVMQAFLFVALSATVSAIVLYALFPWALGHFDRRAVKLEIIGNHMSTVVEGHKFAFSVVAKNAAGVVVPVYGISVTSGNATVSPDGTGGVFTASAMPVGEHTLTVTDSQLTANLAVTVTPDVTPATLEIVPA